MALPSSGSISMSQVRAELKLSGSINLGHSRVRGLAGRPSGSISMSQLRGKSDKKWVHIKTKSYWGGGDEEDEAYIVLYQEIQKDFHVSFNMDLLGNEEGTWIQAGEYKFYIESFSLNFRDDVDPPSDFDLNIKLQIYHFQ